MTDRCRFAELRRHDFVQIAENATSAIACAPADRAARAAVDAWIRARRPFVVRQQGARASPETVALGLALPRSAHVRRIACTVDCRAMRRTSRPPRVAEAAACAPPRMRGALADLAHRGRALGITFRVFGSVAWQALTGLDYLSETSDVDVLWRPGDAEQLSGGIALLDAWQRDFAIPVDGEILFGDEDAVAWREWRNRGDARRLLVKRLSGPLMREAASLLATLERARARYDPIASAA